MSKKFLRLSVLLLCIMPSVNAFASSFSNLYVFGDSLSDTGNVFALTGGAVPGPPSASYYQGRFTNGPNYIDDLSTRLGLSLTPAKFFPPPPPDPSGNNYNYAYGGARTNSHPSGAPISVKNQVGAFLTGLGGNMADSNALYVLWAGANNVQDAILNAPLSALSSTCDQDSDCMTAMDTAVADIQNMLNQLAGKGAKEFLVPNSPNLGLTPRVTTLESAEPGITAFAASVTDYFNQQLDAILNGLGGLDIKRFDTHTLFQELVNNPGGFGFTNVTGRCYTGDDLNWTGGGTVCTDPNSYLFWDGIHPTAHAHAILAEYAYQAIVPAPATIALISLGLAIIASQQRRRRQAV